MPFGKIVPLYTEITKRWKSFGASRHMFSYAVKMHHSALPLKSFSKNMRVASIPVYSNCQKFCPIRGGLMPSFRRTPESSLSNPAARGTGPGFRRGDGSRERHHFWNCYKPGQIEEYRPRHTELCPEHNQRYLPTWKHYWQTVKLSP